MHQDDVLASDELTEWRKDPANKNLSVAGDDRSPTWTWLTYLYTDGEQVVMPAANIMVALRQAGAQLILKKQKTFKEISQSGLLIDTEYCDFYNNETRLDMADLLKFRDAPFTKHLAEVEKRGFRLYVKRAKIGTSKHVRVRPRFDTWSVQGRIQIQAAEITPDILKQLFDLAGRVGLCDWRPGCKTPGPYGMFTAKLNRI